MFNQQKFDFLNRPLQVMFIVFIGSYPFHLGQSDVICQFESVFAENVIQEIFTSFNFLYVLLLR
jgi:hypothetical protein